MENSSNEFKTFVLLNKRNPLKFPVNTFFSNLNRIRKDYSGLKQPTYFRLGTGTTRHEYANAAELKKAKPSWRRGSPGQTPGR
jgi:hypothetical protein